MTYLTIRDFVDSLDPGDWRLDPDGNLTDGNDNCPIWHIYNGRFSDFDGYDDTGEPNDYVEAGRRCGLRFRDAVAIAEAADNRGHPRLRKRLLAAVGIGDSNQASEEIRGAE